MAIFTATGESMTVASNITDTAALLSARVRIPQGVVYRSFVHETVVLNLETGLYHGVNPTGGRMLDTLGRVGLVRDAASSLARDYDRPLAEVELDLLAFCQALLERGLLVIEPA